MTKRIRVVFDLVDEDLKPRSVDGTELPDWENGPGMLEYLKQKGAQGWHIADTIGGRTIILERTEQVL